MFHSYSCAPPSLFSVIWAPFGNVKTPPPHVLATYLFDSADNSSRRTNRQRLSTFCTVLQRPVGLSNIIALWLSANARCFVWKYWELGTVVLGRFNVIPSSTYEQHKCALRRDERPLSTSSTCTLSRRGEEISNRTPISILPYGITPAAANNSKH